MRLKINRILPGEEVVTTQVPMDKVMWDVQNIMGGMGVASVTITHTDGSTTVYYDLEYECTLCGSYGHPDMSCMCATCLDHLNTHIDDRPARCPECGDDLK